MENFVKYSLVTFFICLFSSSCFGWGRGINANPNSLEYVCALSGGTWNGVEGGYWSCCWANWGCLQCEPNGKCEMACSTIDCRIANDQVRVQPPKKDYTQIPGLVPPGTVAPVIPVKPRPMIIIPLRNIKENQNQKAVNNQKQKG